MDRWGKPAVVIAIDETDAFGSARSIPGFDIVGALGSVSELLEEFGGHRQAAGLQLRADNVEPLREALAATGGEELKLAMQRSADIVCDAELELDDAVLGLARELERLAPFGIGNPRPRLLCRDLKIEEEPKLIKEQHLKLRLASGERGADAIAWRRPELAGILSKGDRFDAVAKLTINRWGGREEPQLELVEVSVDGVPSNS